MELVVAASAVTDLLGQQGLMVAATVWAFAVLDWEFVVLVWVSVVLVWVFAASVWV